MPAKMIEIDMSDDTFKIDGIDISASVLDASIEVQPDGVMVNLTLKSERVKLNGYEAQLISYPGSA